MLTHVYLYNIIMRNYTHYTVPLFTNSKEQHKRRTLWGKPWGSSKSDPAHRLKLLIFNQLLWLQVGQPFRWPLQGDKFSNLGSHNLNPGWLVGWVGLGWVGLGWVGLGWVGLGWVGLGWVGLGWVGLGWVGLGWVGLGWVGLGWVGLGWVGLGWLVGCIIKIHGNPPSSLFFCGEFFEGLDFSAFFHGFWGAMDIKLPWKSSRPSKQWCLG